MADEGMKVYFNGEKLYGDDFGLDELTKWFEDEAEGYANLVGARATTVKDRGEGQYSYYALNQRHGFRFLPNKRFSHVLGFGSTYGYEFKPLLDRAEQITVIEPSDAFTVQEIYGVPASYIKPNVDGSLPLPDNSFDLITCFGVLHHIASVSTVMGEFCRCLKLGGYVLIREPIVSMGDWRKHRPGLTKRERGIPVRIFRQIISAAGFEIVSEKKCMFSLTGKLKYFIKGPVYNSNTALFIDELFSWLFGWNNKYHASGLFDKLRPTGVFYVLAKPSGA
jgi:SAM-dependent methyltransferase